MRVLVLYVCLFCLFCQSLLAIEERKSSSWIESFKERVFSFLQPTTNPVVKDGNLASETDTDTSPSDIVANNQVAELLRTAEEKIEMGELESALDHLLDTVNRYPDDQRATALTGALLLSFQQFEAAEDMLYHAIRLSNWTDVPSIINLSNLLRLQGDPNLALKTLTKGYLSGDNSKDEDGKLSFQFGEIYRNLSKYTEAHDFYLSAAIKMHTNEEAWLRASTLLSPESVRDFKVAENVLIEAVNQTNRNSSELIFYLGYVMYSTDRIDAAITFFTEAVVLDENNLQAWSGLATAYHTKREFDQAFQYYRRYLEKNPNNAAMLANFAVLLKEVDRIQEAEKVLSRAYDLDANDPIVLRIMQQLNAVPANAVKP